MAHPFSIIFPNNFRLRNIDLIISLLIFESRKL